MKCTALLEHRIETNDRDYLNSGNVLLDRLFDCAIEYRPSGADMNAEAEAKGEALRAEPARSPTSSPAAAPTASARSATCPARRN